MSTSNLQPLTLWGGFGPNPLKVSIILRLLKLPYKIESVALSDLKQPPYLAINPNGRIPALQDPNTNLTLWESGAIIEYLMETYDTAHTLSFARGTPESFLAKQWLFFQVSGQGPYYGQAVWFKKYHSERVESAVQRYLNEIKRVVGVVEGHLKGQEQGADGPWLVGGKFSFADVSWLMWQNVVEKLFTKEEFDPEEFPVVSGWLKRIREKEGVREVLDSAGSH